MTQPICCTLPPEGRALAAERAWLWPVGSEVKVSVSHPFAILAEALGNWAPHVNLHLQYTSIWLDAQIRISTDPKRGNWSAIGTGALHIPRDQPTMNIADVSQPFVWLHEFGHALGFHHEHQSPASPIQWNKAAVYRDMAQLGWNEAKVNGNIFHVYEKAEPATPFDPASVMGYPIPGHWTHSHPQGIQPGQTLSELDKAGARLFYPATSDEQNIKWIKRAYLDVLEREADEPSLKWWLAQIADLGRNITASLFISSEERRRLRMAEMYERLLGRAMTQADYDAWGKHGDYATPSLEGVEGGILASDEYFDKVGK